LIFLKTVLSGPGRKKSLKKEELKYFMVWRTGILYNGLEASNGDWKSLEKFLKIYSSKSTHFYSGSTIYKTYYANYCYCAGSVQFDKSTTTVILFNLPEWNSRYKTIKNILCKLLLMCWLCTAK
jgi:hypothetical protein